MKVKIVHQLSRGERVVCLDRGSPLWEYVGRWEEADGEAKEMVEEAVGWLKGGQPITISAPMDCREEAFDLAQYLANLAGDGYGERAHSYPRKDFLNRLKDGHAFQAMVAHYLIGQGFRVHMEPLTVAVDTREAIEAMTVHDVDIMVEGRIPLEVKTVKYEFTRPSEYPYSPVYMETYSSYAQRKLRPWAYVLVSAPTGAMIAAPATGGLKVVRGRDNGRNLSMAYIAVDRSQLITMQELVRLLYNELRG